jgi:hypothetical protein
MSITTLLSLPKSKVNITYGMDGTSALLGTF